MKTIITAMLILGTFISVYAGLNFEKYVIEENIPAEAVNYDFRFKFKNKSANQIKIIDIKTDCGCTIIKNEKSIFLPHEEGAINGTFTIGKRIGLHEKRIFIKTDNIGQPKIELLLKADIEPIVTIKPAMLFWRSGSIASEKTVSVILNEKIETNAISIESDSKNFTFQKQNNENAIHGFILKIKPNSTNELSRGAIKIKVKNQTFDKLFHIQCLIK